MSSSSTKRLLVGVSLAIVVLAVALVATIVATCSGGSGRDGTPTATETPAATEESASDAARATVVAAEADDDPSLPGEYVDLPGIYGASYGGRPNTAAHVREVMDYSVQGLPPAGGPHWGNGSCGNDPSVAPPFCGPAEWGIYREPWPAETLVHNMEHAGVIIWYNTSDQDVIDELEAFASENLNDDVTLVMAPYPDMEAQTVAITVWGRRDTMAASELDLDRLQGFIDVLYCRFNPENLPCLPRSD